MNTKYPDGAIAAEPGIKGFGARLKCVREMRHLTQEDLATRTGLHPAAVSHFETGERRPGIANLRRLCLALNCAADYLIDSHTTSTP